MIISALEQAISQLPTELSGVSVGELITLESGFDSIFASLAAVSSIAASQSSLVTTLDSILETVHAKIDATLNTFIELGKIASTFSADGGAVLSSLKPIYNLMLSLIHALRPVEDLVCKMYPSLVAVFDLLNSLKPLS